MFVVSCEESMQDNPIVEEKQKLYNGIPVVEVNVQDGESVDSKEVWKSCIITIGEDYYDTVVSDGRIRG